MLAEVIYGAGSRQGQASGGYAMPLTRVLELEGCGEGSTVRRVVDVGGKKCVRTTRKLTGIACRREES